MTTDIAKASEIGQKIIASNLELRSKHSYLASFLLQEREKGVESKWHRYISILPQVYDTVPLFFSEEQKKLLIGSICVQKIEDRTKLLRYEYDGLCAAIPEYNKWSFEEFMWGRLCVITRISKSIFSKTSSIQCLTKYTVLEIEDIGHQIMIIVLIIMVENCLESKHQSSSHNKYHKFPYKNYKCFLHNSYQVFSIISTI